MVVFRHVDHNRFLLTNEIDYVLEGPATLAIPKHESIVSLSGHCTILRREVREVFAGLVISLDRFSLPLADVVPGLSLHAEDSDLPIMLFVQIFLDRLINAIRITYEDHESILGDVIDSPLNLFTQARKASRPCNEHLSSFFHILFTEFASTLGRELPLHCHPSKALQRSARE